MSNRRKTGFPKDISAIQAIDNMTWDDSFESEPMPREEAEKEYARLTENGTKNTKKTSSIFYYKLIQKA